MNDESIYITDAEGNKIWKNSNGQRHRVDGPAIERANGSKFWYFKGMRHRVDGPAIEYADGEKRWYFKNMLHRVDGPAIEYADGEKQYWYNGKQIPEGSYASLTPQA